MRTAFDADVLIYAAAPDNPLGKRIRVLPQEDGAHLGSTLLLPELLAKPVRMGWSDEIAALRACLARLELLDVTPRIAALAVSLEAAYGLRAPDAVHLATAVEAGADRFVTNNRKDFDDGAIREIPVVFPDGL